jgi:hypothetical protein
MSPDRDGDRGNEVLTNLPHSRPQRSTKRREQARSGKARAASASPRAAKPKRAATPKPNGVRPSAATSRARTSDDRSGAPSGTEVLTTVIEAAGEVAQIGLTAGVRALREAISRLPRP